MNDKLHYSEEEISQMFEAVLQGATLSDVAHVEQDTLEAGYGLAYSLYTAGNYADAATMFRGLCLYDHTDTRFWMGLAGALQGLNDYAGAVQAYGVAVCTSGMGDPGPVVYGALCNLKLGNKEDATKMFKASLDMGNAEEAAHAAHHQKARSMLEMLERGE